MIQNHLMRYVATVFFLTLIGCQHRPVQEPDFIIQDAHSSGNLVVVDAAGGVGLSGGLDGALRILNLDTGESLAFWKAHEGAVNGAFIDVEAGLIISGGWDGYLRQWNLSGRLLRSRQTHQPISAMAFSGSHGAFWTGHADGSVRRWRANDFSLQQQAGGKGRRITALALHQGQLAIADHAGRVALLNEQGKWRLLSKLPTYARTLVFSGDGQQLFAGSWFYIYRWNVESGQMQRLDTDHRGIIVSLAWSPARNELVSISRQTDSSVLALDPQTGRTTRDFGQHELCGAGVDISQNGRYLMTTSDDASVRIWHLTAE